MARCFFAVSVKNHYAKATLVSVQGPTGKHNDGCFIAIYNVSAFRELETFKAEVTEFAEYLKATAPAQGVK